MSYTCTCCLIPRLPVLEWYGCHTLVTCTSVWPWMSFVAFELYVGHRSMVFICCSAVEHFNCKWPLYSVTANCACENCLCRGRTEKHQIRHGSMLRGVKDWVHMKTAKIMQDFNWLCNWDVNHKLLLIFINKVVYLCTLHNKIISPTHFVVYVLWRPMLTWFSNINA